jgi:hypothetical protein
MSFLDFISDISLDDVSNVLGVGGTIAGGLGLGGDNSRMETVEWGSGMNPAARQQMTDLLERIRSYGKRPYQGVPRRGMTADDLDPVFGSKARQQLYDYYNTPIPIEAGTAPAATDAAARTDSATLSPDVLEALVIGQYGTLPDAQKQKAMAMLAQVKSRSGQKNKYSGDSVDYPAWLQGQMKMGNSGARGALIPHAYDDYRAGFDMAAPSQHAATYDPSSSFLDRILPSIALAAMTGGIGMGASALAGPAMAGGISPAIAAKGLKAITTLTKGLQ